MNATHGVLHMCNEARSENINRITEKCPEEKAGGIKLEGESKGVKKTDLQSKCSLP